MNLTEACEALKLKQRIEIKYSGRDRVVEVHAAGSAAPRRIAVIRSAGVNVSAAFSPRFAALQGPSTTTPGTDSVKLIGFILLACLPALAAAHAAGWESVQKYVKPTGQCAGQEILASSYSSGKHTASGEAFDANGNTAAARTWPLGTSLTVTNPRNGRSVTVRINDTGPWGIAYAKGARLDLARGAAARLGMRGSQYVCVM